MTGPLHPLDMRHPSQRHHLGPLESRPLHPHVGFLGLIAALPEAVVHADEDHRQHRSPKQHLSDLRMAPSDHHRRESAQKEPWQAPDHDG